MAKTTTQDQRIIIKFSQETYLPAWVEAFLLDCKVRNLSPRTIEFYKEKLSFFLKFCDGQYVTQVDEITPDFIRQFMLHLEQRGNNSGGIHAYYRTIKVFLRWYMDEAEPEGWKNPIEKVKPPKQINKILSPVEIDDVIKIFEACERNSFYGERDRAIFLTLFDTGLRASELCNLNISDIELMTGTIKIQLGKGRKPRYVFVGKDTRKALRRWIKFRGIEPGSLFITKDGERITYWGLRQIVRRAAIKARIDTPSLHSFRRAFAITMLRAGVDIISLSRLMGHTSITVLQRYVKQLPADLQEAHRKGSPVDGIY